jgi:hypothetical protein
MPKAHITRHSSDAKLWARLSGGQAISALGGQEGNALDLDLADGTAKSTAVVSAAGLYRIAIDGADVRLRIGAGAVADDTGERWFDGDSDIRYLRSGERISVKVAL